MAKRRSKKSYTDLQKQRAKKRFLRQLALESCLSVAQAAAQAGVARTTIISWRESDPEFDQAVADLAESKLDSLEDAVSEIAHNKKAAPTRDREVFATA